MTSNSTNPAAPHPRPIKTWPLPALLPRVRALTMLWLDAWELVQFLTQSQLTADDFYALPLNRTSLCWLLGALAAKAQALPEPLKTELAPLTLWESFSHLPDLSADKTPFTMGHAEQERCWQAASVAAPELLRRLAQHPDVQEGQAYLEALAHREPCAWPQPSRNTQPTAAQLATYELLKRTLATELPAQGSALVRIWWLPEADVPTSTPAPVTASAATHTSGTTRTLTLVLEHTASMNDEVARTLVQTLEQACGITPVLVSQLSLHPLLWDSSVAAELLVWEAADASALHNQQLMPAAFAAHEHEHSSEHPHHH